MGLLDNIFGSGSDPAVPGGNISKPLMIALLALLARYMTSGSKDASGSVSPNAAPESTADASPGEIVGGLGGLLKQFQQNGFGDAINSWMSTGPTKSATADEVSYASGVVAVGSIRTRWIARWRHSPRPMDMRVVLAFRHSKKGPARWIA